MPFCTNCGTEVGTTDKYCANCGAPQAATPGTSSTIGADVPPPPPRGSDPVQSMSPRTASMMCYVPLMGWVASIVILASPRFQKDGAVRFHAFQGLYLFVAWLIVQMVIDPMLDSGHNSAANLMSALLQISVWVGWIFMLIRTSNNQTYSLPLIGELAERSVAEQRSF